MKTRMISQYCDGESGGEGVARPVVKEKGAIRGEEEERGSSEDGETLVLKAGHGPARVGERATLAR
jgi:hypothetical protein